MNPCLVSCGSLRNFLLAGKCHLPPVTVQVDNLLRLLVSLLTQESEAYLVFLEVMILQICNGYLWCCRRNFQKCLSKTTKDINSLNWSTMLQCNVCLLWYFIPELLYYSESRVPCFWVRTVVKKVVHEGEEVIVRVGELLEEEGSLNSWGSRTSSWRAAILLCPWVLKFPTASYLN